MAQEADDNAGTRVNDIAANTMLGDLRDLCMKEIKHGVSRHGKPFDTWTEDDQRACVNRVVDECEWAITKGVSIIRAEGAPYVEATVEQVTVKDTIKATMKVPPVKGASDLLTKMVGAKVLIISTDIGAYMGARRTGDSHVTDDEPALIEESVDPDTGEIGGDSTEANGPDEADHDDGQ